jgi:ABC-2 type transport system ATP-binding protein
MQRKLEVALSLVHRPEVLFLDEPTTGLDPEVRADMWQEIARLAQQETMTILLTTHYLEEAESLCRNIAIIDQGRIVENTSMRALLGKLAMQTLVFDTVNEISASPQFNDPQVNSQWIDSHSFEVTMSTDRDINALFTILNQQNVLIKSMRNKTNRLEELFLSSLGNQ